MDLICFAYGNPIGLLSSKSSEKAVLLAKVANFCSSKAIEILVILKLWQFYPCAIFQFFFKKFYVINMGGPY